MIGGDAKSAAIAAASVIAKETRDRYMRRADAPHPGWEFAQHVGYATPEHREAIERLGVSPLHRPRRSSRPPTSSFGPGGVA